jgi:hypothetical protein
MTSANLKAQFASMLLNVFPSAIGNAVISNGALADRLGVPTTVSSSFANGGPTFDRGQMVDCIRRVLTGEVEVTLRDINEAYWQVSADPEDEFSVVFSRRQEVFRYSGNWMFSPDESLRVLNFKAECSRLGIRGEELEGLSAKLRERTWTAEEANVFLTIGKDTAIGQRERVEALFASQRFNAVDLVPQRYDYYTNLVGVRGDASSLLDYAIGPGADQLDKLMNSGAQDGLEQLFLIAGHPGLIVDHQLKAVTNDDFAKALARAVRSGDMYTKLGALAVALQTYGQWSDIDDPIQQLTTAILDADVTDASGSGFSSTSAFFVLVYGELARTKVLANHPPFWRRLAAMTHASLLARAFAGSSLNKASVLDWVLHQRPSEFLVQSYCDLREEPRWLPDYIVAQQLKDDFIGRIAGLVNLHSESFAGTKLQEVFFTDDSALKKSIRFPQAFYPSVVEGGTEPLSKIPDEYLARLRSELADLGEQATASDFAGLVNGAHVFEVGAEHAQLAAALLRKARQRIASNCSSHDFEQLLLGLAAVAATTRSIELAGELQILSRIARQGSNKPEPLTEFSAAFIASAAMEDIDAWAAFIGSWVVEIAYSIEKPEEASALGRLLAVAGWLENRLVSTFSRAGAAIQCV